MNDRQKLAFMDVAERFAQLSYATKLKVGAIVVKDNRIISIGYNGTPPGWDNECEYAVSSDEGDDAHGSIKRLKTKPEVIHAERNALDKLVRSSESSVDATMFITHNPCFECAKSIFNTGIRTIYYRHNYKNDDGIAFLRKCGVDITQI